MRREIGGVGYSMGEEREWRDGAQCGWGRYERQRGMGTRKDDRGMGDEWKRGEGGVRGIICIRAVVVLVRWEEGDACFGVVWKSIPGYHLEV